MADPRRPLIARLAEDASALDWTPSAACRRSVLAALTARTQEPAARRRPAGARFLPAAAVAALVLVWALQPVAPPGRPSAALPPRDPFAALRPLAPTARDLVESPLLEEALRLGRQASIGGGFLAAQLWQPLQRLRLVPQWAPDFGNRH